MRFHNIFLPVLLGLILLLFNLLVIMEVAYAMPPKSGDMIKFIENNPPVESPSTPFIGPSGQQVTLRDYKKTWTLINFWATWCAPCKKEMPSLDKLKTLNEFKNINIIPINIGGESYKKSKEFFDEIKIKNLDIFTGSGPEFSQLFKLRGLPTTILIDRNGFEVGRIVGYIDFNDQSLLDWLPKIL